MDKHHITKSKLKAIGVTLPGLITSDGIVAVSTPLYWNNIPLKKILSEHFDFVGENFGKIIAIAITCYDPNIIVLSGYAAKQCPEYLINIIKKKIATEICASQYRNIRFIVEYKEEKAFARSVATTALWELQQSQAL